MKDTSLADHLLDRIGWALGCLVIGSLGTLAGLYLADPDLERRTRNAPLVPDALAVRDPLYVVLWSVAVGGVLVMAPLLLLMRRRDKP